jgi:Flp pilus assembly protein TadG
MSTSCPNTSCETRKGGATPLGQRRRGAMAVLAILVLPVLIVTAAFAVELSLFMAEKAEMQRSADAGAMAACWEYIAQKSKNSTETVSRTKARTLAQTMAGDNLVGYEELSADANSENSSSGDIVFGNYTTWGDPHSDLTAITSSSAKINAVKVRLRQTADRNGEVRFTLASLIGVNTKPLNAESTAAFGDNIRGFQMPSSGESNLDVIPFAVKDTLWNSLMAGSGPDSFSYNPNTKTVSVGGDGVKELNIFPQNTNASGNSGTVDIGNAGNSTADLKRQIEQGINQNDLSYHGGKLELGSNGTVILNGDTGISAGMKASLESIIGKPRVMMVYSQVNGPGNNAMFTIVKFVGIRIVGVNFQGSKNQSKYVYIQPAPVVLKGGIVNPGTSVTSEGVYTPVVLVR